MMEQLDSWIPKIGEQLGTTKFEKTNETTWAIDVVFKLRDGSTRYQWVYISYCASAVGGNDILDIRSKVADYSPTINLKGMAVNMKTACYSSIVIRETTKDNMPIELLYVQSGPHCKYINSMEELQTIIYEVASMADILEEKFIMQDKN